MHNQEGQFECNPDQRYEIAEAVWACGGYVKWNATSPNAILVLANADKFADCVAALNAIVNPVQPAIV